MFILASHGGGTELPGEDDCAHATAAARSGIASDANPSAA